MPYPPAPWRSAIQPASFRGAGFHVETDQRISGRRIALHEYPKRDDCYSEDMGKRAVRYSVTGYIITRPVTIQVGGPATPPATGGLTDYRAARDALIAALEQDGPGALVHPLFPVEPRLCMCENYTVSETRDKGGMCTFEMQFVEVGSAVPITGTTVNTQANVLDQAAQTNQAVTDGGAAQLRGVPINLPGNA